MTEPRLSKLLAMLEHGETVLKVFQMESEVHVAVSCDAFMDDLPPPRLGFTIRISETSGSFRGSDTWEKGMFHEVAFQDGGAQLGVKAHTEITARLAHYVAERASREDSHDPESWCILSQCYGLPEKNRLKVSTLNFSRMARIAAHIYQKLELWKNLIALYVLEAEHAAHHGIRAYCAWVKFELAEALEADSRFLEAAELYLEIIPGAEEPYRSHTCATNAGVAFKRARAFKKAEAAYVEALWWNPGTDVAQCFTINGNLWGTIMVFYQTAAEVCKEFTTIWTALVGLLNAAGLCESGTLKMIISASHKRACSQVLRPRISRAEALVLLWGFARARTVTKARAFVLGALGSDTSTFCWQGRTERQRDAAEECQNARKEILRREKEARMKMELQIGLSRSGGNLRVRIAPPSASQGAPAPTAPAGPWHDMFCMRSYVHENRCLRYMRR